MTESDIKEPPKKNMAGTCRHVVILSDSLSFPRGMAGARRVQLLARGLAEEGVQSTVMLVVPNEKPANPANTEARGTFRGVDYEYTSGTPIRSRSWLKRRWNDLRGISWAFVRLWQMKRAGRLDVLILYTLNMAAVARYSFWARRLGVPVVQELCEWPLDQAAVHETSTAKARDFCERALVKADAVLPISVKLEEHIQAYSARTGRPLPSLRIPILVDMAAFTSAPGMAAGTYFVCSGSIAYMNIIGVILDMCRELKRRGVRCTVRFTGQATPAQIERFKSEAKSRGVGEMVEYLGYLDDDSLLQHYRGATALLAPLPDDPQSVSRFPTKLGEYLTTGRPVLTTGLGEVGRYLADGVTAFMASACSAPLLADKIEEIMNDPARAARIAQAGRQLAQQEFDFIAHGRRLKAFLDGLLAQDGRANHATPQPGRR